MGRKLDPRYRPGWAVNQDPATGRVTTRTATIGKYELVIRYATIDEPDLTFEVRGSIFRTGPLTFVQGATYRYRTNANHGIKIGKMKLKLGRMVEQLEFQDRAKEQAPPRAVPLDATGYGYA